MADFGQAVDITLQHEGGYSSDPVDPGGETKYGISKRSYPQLDIASITVDDAKAIYKRDFWHYDSLDSQLIANKVFDLGVNCGVKPAVKMLQESLVDNGEPVVVDGIFGPITIAASNAADSESVLQSLKLQALAHYNNLVAEQPALGKFLRGWYQRALS